jgi:hypothetical protein
MNDHVLLHAVRCATVLLLSGFAVCESHTNARFGVEDGAIEWADLGPTQGDGCN